MQGFSVMQAVDFEALNPTNYKTLACSYCSLYKAYAYKRGVPSKTRDVKIWSYGGN